MKYGINMYDRDTKERITLYNLDILGEHLDTREEAEDTVAEWKHIDEIDGNDIDYEIVEVEDDDACQQRLRRYAR